MIRRTSQGKGGVQPVQANYFIGTATRLVDSIIFIINALLVLAAIAAIVYLIISGVRYITSQGDEQVAEQARRGIIYAIIGVIIILLSFVLINYFVVNVV
jgi:hypothetical protein